MTKEQTIEVLRCNTNLGYGIVIENESTQLIKEAIEMAIKALEQNTVPPTQSWIPVSERLPTKEEYIANNGLFIVTDGNRTYAEYFDVYNSMRYFGEPTMNGFRADLCVLAWQPLPEPYEEKWGNENG